jgi:hypothetical protein
VDINPFAVEIARFRMLIAALNACGIERLRNAPDFRINVAAGDSLLHGRRFGQLDLGGEAENLATRYSHAYATEDLADLNRILGQQYHAVVGNPPYITPKDSALNEIYRARYGTCHMKYSLAVPFTERFFELAAEGAASTPAGFVGMITANSFMKREFGRKLIEEFLPRLDLTHVIDTAGAYIPGHGTPTVIMFGRHRRPIEGTVRTVMGIKGEPATPEEPARGQVWLEITGSVDNPDHSGEFVSVADVARENFAKHPWSLAGGGATDLRTAIESAGFRKVKTLNPEIGFGCVMSEEEAFSDNPVLRRMVAKRHLRSLVEGEVVRDWRLGECGRVLFPYSDDIELLPEGLFERALFWARTTLGARRDFGNRSYREVGRPWWEYHQIPVARNRDRLVITFASVATHNHFVFDRGRRVFKQSSPVIKLPGGSGDDEYLALLGPLNSSIACFWLKQVCHNKGSTVDERGARQRTSPFEDFYDVTGTKVAEFPLPLEDPVDLSRAAHSLAQQLVGTLPAAVVSLGVPTRALLDSAREQAARIRAKMIALQEELDWRCYHLYRLVDEGLECPDPPEISLGERAFEIALARRVLAGGEQTTWFERHGSSAITELPKRWPAEYRALVERRLVLIESGHSIALIERPEYKRRWNDERKRPVWAH